MLKIHIKLTISAQVYNIYIYNIQVDMLVHGHKEKN